MAKALTVRSIEAAKPRPGRQEIPDGLLPGLYLVVQPSGARSWAVRYRHKGRPAKHTLGRYPAIDLAAARKLAGVTLRAVAEGRNPAEERKQSRALKADTVEAIAAQFVERHCRRANRPQTAAGTERMLRLHVLPRWRGRSVHEITRRDVLDLLDQMADGGKPIAANRTLSALRKMFNWCASRDILTASPCAGVKPPAAERSRDRTLTDFELCAVWRAAECIGYPFGSLVQLLILTGQRRDECAGMRWPEVDLATRTWTLPPSRVKNNRPHEVPLSDAAIAVLDAAPRIDSDIVLTTNGTTPFSGYSKSKRRLDATLPPDMPAWRLHDIRRTVASGMARIGVGLPAVEKVLNHASGSFAGIVGVYQKHSFADEKRAALDRWGAFVTGLVSGEPSTVVPIRGRR